MLLLCCPSTPRCVAPVFLTVVVENFSEADKVISQDDFMEPFEELREQWSRTDHNRSEKLPAMEVASMLWYMQPPAGPYPAPAGVLPFVHTVDYFSTLEIPIESKTQFVR